MPALYVALIGAFAACSSTGPSDAGSTGGSSGTTGGDAGDAGRFPDAGDAGPGLYGIACSAGDQCPSGICGISGTGHCCRSACTEDGGAACGAVDCDSDGRCLYPGPQVDCGGPNCAGGQVTANACNGFGACEQVRSYPCPGNLGCSAGGSSCLATCQTSEDCRSGYYCRNATCLPQQDAGYCDSADVCFSGICLGGGCCAEACPGSAESCAATACELTAGRCVYPNSLTPCGDAGQRSCELAQLTGPYCDGKGSCGLIAAQTCAALQACDPSTASCYAGCADAGPAACAPGAVCSGNLCCPALLAGGALQVSQDTGSDQGCCGSATQPCATLTHALELISASDAIGVVVTLSASTGKWQGSEQYPLQLDHGVTISAPGISFAALAGTIFTVAGRGDAGSGAVSLEGANGVPLNVGLDQLDQVAIQVGTDAGLPASLTLSNVALGGLVTALDVLPGGSATLVGGTSLGNDNGVAVRCSGTVRAPSSLSVQHYHPVTASNDTVIGGVELDGKCTASFDDFELHGTLVREGDLPQQSQLFGVRAIGGATVSLSNGSVNDFYEDALELLPDDAGSVPTLSLDGVTVSGAGCAGLLQVAGTTNAAGSLFRQNPFGVVLEGPGRVNLGGVGDAGNEIEGPNCLTHVPLHCPADFPVLLQNPTTYGVGILNDSRAGTIHLDGTQVGPDSSSPLVVWECTDLTLQHCSCGPGCSGAPPNGAAIVGLSTNPAPFTTVGLTENDQCP